MLWIANPSSNATVTASDSAGRTGISNTFTVQAPPDADSDRLPDVWESAYNLATASNSGDNGPDGDPDHDGISNLLEYAFDSNPRVAGLAHGPFALTKVHQLDGRPYLEFTYRRRAAASGLTYAIETSADCIGWSPSTAAYETVSVFPPGSGETAETVTVRILPAVGSPGGEARFARLRVTSP